MENALLELKEKMKLVYAGYGSYLVVLFKFLLALVVFEEINGILPYVEVLDQLFVVLLAALICSIMPWNLMVFCGMGLIVGQCYGVGIEVAGFALALMVIMVIFSTPCLAACAFSAAARSSCASSFLPRIRKMI